MNALTNYHLCQKGKQSENQRIDMPNPHQEINQRILDTMTQLQTDLDKALQKIFEQAGSKIQLEKQEEFQREVENTKLLLKRFKSRYA
ncbi:hypothetical protein [Chroococcidiopsis sp. TS-821]|uniref:hypothetical protein n=1 Tax=Chroococcidiopsis sp. TS-821 TaxID=1378066 RepID=UPI000CEF1A25|nr:hypothetical protein [Chroococcidiopsis sp. TS-821]PPS39614.1 hypothetical protein B1A85_22225 [Chroococcidiopsis sp. TS-821]